MSFTPTSKMGKSLMLKYKTLREENEEIGNQAKEGKIHELSMKLASQKSKNVELTSHFEGLLKNMEGLTDDAEKSNEMVRILEEKLADKEAEIQRLRNHLQQKCKSSTVEEIVETHAADKKDTDEDVIVTMEDENEES